MVPLPDLTLSRECQYVCGLFLGVFDMRHRPHLLQVCSSTAIKRPDKRRAQSRRTAVETGLMVWLYCKSWGAATQPGIHFSPVANRDIAAENPNAQKSIFP